ncbi:MAG: hypothetical protein ACYTDU_17725 [Planctomycetota bacterium]|jgi:hypothetical protein
MRRLAELAFFSLCTAFLVWALIRWLPPERETEADGAGDQVATAVNGDDGVLDLFFACDDDADVDLFVVHAPTGMLTYDDDGVLDLFIAYDDDADVDLFVVPAPTGK